MCWKGMKKMRGRKVMQMDEQRRKKRDEEMKGTDGRVLEAESPDCECSSR